MSKRLMIVWFLIISLLLSTILFIHYSTLDFDLIKYEQELKKASYNYFKDNSMFPSLNESSVVYIDDLVEKGYINKNEKQEKYCIKSVEVINRLYVKMYTINKKCEEVLKGEE